jgi:UDP-3-O-[3-hydroxymyristoyl] glucosamine N-acyltransferase
MNCAIGHNCSIGKFSSLSPSVSLGGNTQIGNNVELGIGASTLQTVVVEDDAKVGGKAMVVKNVAKSTVVIGIPAKVK